MGKNEVALYICNINEADTESLLEKYGFSFEKERLMRISRCSNAKNKQRLVATGVCLYKILKKYNLELSMTSYSEYGKPFIPNNEGIFYNVSHSGAFLVLAVSSQPVGVDVQKKAPLNEKVVDKICSSSEARLVKENFADRFNYVWSLKEASAKLHGDGLANGMHRFEIDYSKKDPDIYFKEELFGHIKTLDFHEDYALAVACHEKFNIIETVIVEEVL